MRVVERITGTAGRYVLTSAVGRDDSGAYVARATAFLLTAARSGRPLRSVATARSSSLARGTLYAGIHMAEDVAGWRSPPDMTWRTGSARGGP